MVIVGRIVLPKLNILERRGLANLPMEASWAHLGWNGSNINYEVSDLAHEVTLIDVPLLIRAIGIFHCC